MISDGRIVDAKAIMLLQYAALRIFPAALASLPFRTPLCPEADIGRFSRPVQIGSPPNVIS
jgi:hypothetical protein